MKESHLVVQADALNRADEFCHQQAVAEPEHGIDRIAGRPPRSLREPDIALRYDLSDRTGISFDAFEHG